MPNLPDPETYITRNSLPAPNLPTVSTWLVLFGFVYAVMHVLPAIMSHNVWNGLTSGDLLNVVTPYLVLAVAWKVVLLLRSRQAQVDAAIILMLAATILYANGHGINLAANAIARHLQGLSDQPIYHLTYFFDEGLGHWFWHAGVLTLTVAMLSAASQSHIPSSWPLLLGTPFFAFAFFTDGVEGQTTFFMLPGAIFILGWILLRARGNFRRIFGSAVEGFFFVGYAQALVLFAVWGIWQGGFPQFSELGWI